MRINSMTAARACDAAPAPCARARPECSVLRGRAAAQQWADAHHRLGCVAPQCVPHFTGLGAAAAAELRVAGWDCGWRSPAATDDEFAHGLCTVRLADRNGTGTIIHARELPRLCTPEYYCPRLAGEDAGGVDWHRVALAGFPLLGALDRGLVLRVARSQPRRLAELRQLGGGSEAAFRARLAASSRALAAAVWLPVLSVPLVSAALTGNTDSDAVLLLPLFLDLLPAASLAATVLLLWAECAAIGAIGSAIVEGIAATPEAERDVGAALRSFGKVQAALAAASARWSGVLLLQLLLFGAVTALAAAVLLAGNASGATLAGDAGIAVGVPLPLGLSFAAVVRANALFDSPVQARLAHPPSVHLYRRRCR